MILAHSCRLGATYASRHYVPYEGYQRKRDGFDPRNFMEGNVEVLRSGDFADEDEHRGSDKDEAPLGFGLAESTSSTPALRFRSARELANRLGGVSPEDRRMPGGRASPRLVLFGA
ncbi:hypothetical protein [Sorangium cellulosum]|uniref:hypothetical protein n=1 Tax=Sorangium cellulosum TaxID=56 RepID=UPI0011DE31A9|nr:hypothetical protein [Sorangium cellulosum]